MTIACLRCSWGEGRIKKNPPSVRDWLTWTDLTPSRSQLSLTPFFADSALVWHAQGAWTGKSIRENRSTYREHRAHNKFNYGRVRVGVENVPYNDWRQNEKKDHVIHTVWPERLCGYGNNEQVSESGSKILYQTREFCTSVKKKDGDRWGSKELSYRATKHGTGIFYYRARGLGMLGERVSKGNGRGVWGLVYTSAADWR